MPPPPDSRTTRRQDCEETALELVHSVMDDDWSSDTAGRRVWTRARGDRNVLLLLRARVARHLAGMHSPIDERAAATLDAALRADEIPSHTLSGQELLVPRQSTG